MYVKHAVILLLMVMNIVGFLTVKMDKGRAIENRWRIPEKRFLHICMLGGCLGVYSGLIAYRHKTRRRHFMLGIPAIMFIQASVAFYWLY